MYVHAYAHFSKLHIGMPTLFFVSLFLSVVNVGFVRSVYTASERDMSANVCIEVKQGTLGIPVDLSLTTHNGSAQGTVHAQCHASI